MITVSSRYYGREGQLNTLRATMADYNISYTKRRKAAEIYHEIIRQCNDETLMTLRLRLIRAAQAGDREWMAKLSSEMKLYLGEDPESGGEQV